MKLPYIHVDLKIFVVKIFFGLCTLGKYKHICQQMIIRVSTWSYTWFYSTASQSFRARQLLLWYSQVTHGKWVTIFSVPDKSSVFTVSVRAYSVLQFSFTHKYMVQCTNSCVVTTNCKLFVVYVFLFYFIYFFFWRAYSCSRSWKHRSNLLLLKKKFRGILDHKIKIYNTKTSRSEVLRFVIPHTVHTLHQMQRSTPPVSLRRW